MGKSENFLNKKSSDRGITEEPVVVEESQPEFSVEQILDALGQYFDARLNTIEEKLDVCLGK